MDVSNQIRAKPDWNSKYKNADIVSKWRKELSDQDLQTKHLNEVFDYVLKELEWYDRLETSDTEFSAAKFKFGPDDRITYSDGAIDSKAASRLLAGIAEFEKNTTKDYHPGLNNLVVDLVHPSLYHLEYDRTKILKNGKLEVVQFDDTVAKFKADVSYWGISNKFQWLPAELVLTASKQFVFDSYINNLHPIEYRGLYDSIGAIFNRIVPGLNMSLARTLSEEYIRVPIPNYTDAYNDKFDEYMKGIWDLYDKSDGSFEDQVEELEAQRSNYLKEFPPQYTKDPVTKEFDIRDFSRLKVVVKLANIELTPDQPKYAGGSWHVEGTINEDIVATALYYYDMENIKDSKLSFRAAYEDPNYEQGDSLYCEHFFGLKDEDKMTHFVGSVNAVKDRVLIFPNVFQHHVDAFELEDSLKPGFRKILCFFLVDPYNDIVKSTRDVPPQQIDWVSNEKLMREFFPSVKPQDISTITLEEAKQRRDELMLERSAAVKDDEDGDFDNAFARLFSLCEH